MFADRLKSLMKERKVTWKEVSETLKIGKNQLKYWKDHDTVPDGLTLAKLSKYFGVTIDYLIGNDTIKEEIFDILAGELTEQEKTLIKLFRGTSEEGRMRIIYTIMEENK